MHKILLCLGLALLPILSFAEEPAGLNRAAVQALKEAFNAPNGFKWEYGGVIVLRNRSLVWTTPPHTDQLPDGNLMNPKKMLLSGDVLVGLYHTHPCFSNTHFPGYFSMPDVAFAIYNNTTEFILDECTGNVQKYDPILDNPEKLSEEVDYQDVITREVNVRRLMKGHVIGNIGQRGPQMD